jgi:hypothetical protein
VVNVNDSVERARANAGVRGAGSWDTDGPRRAGPVGSGVTQRDGELGAAT